MTEEKTCYNCGNKNCIVYYSTAKKDCKRHYETYEYTNFECVNHDKWKELKVEEIRTDNTKTLKNALERITELEKENTELRTKTTALENANRAMVKELDEMTSGGVSVLENVVRSKEQLAKAESLITRLSTCFSSYSSNIFEEELLKEAEQFLKEVGECL